MEKETNILAKRIADKLHAKFCISLECPEGKCPWQDEEAVAQSGAIIDLWDFPTHERFLKHALDLQEIFMQRLSETFEEMDAALRPLLHPPMR